MALPAAADAPPAGVFAVGLLNSKLDSVLAVDTEKSQMRVGTGMDLNGLYAAATANKMSVVVSSPSFLCLG